MESVALTKATMAAEAREPLPQLEPKPAPAWRFETLAGRITEVRVSPAGAGFTLAAWVLREAQERGEPAAYVATGDSMAYPPDLHDFGVDLETLVILRLASALDGAAAAELLLRSGSFGFVLLDLAEDPGVPPRGIEPERRAGGVGRNPSLPSAALMRLAALCRRHEAALLCLTRVAAGGAEEEADSGLGSLVSLRARGSIQRIAPHRYSLEILAVKDKRHGPGWSQREVLRGPDGLS